MNTVPRAHSLGKTYKEPSGVGWHSNSDKPTNLDGAYPAKVSILSKLGSRSTPANTGRVPNSSNPVPLSRQAYLPQWRDPKETSWQVRSQPRFEVHPICSRALDWQIPWPSRGQQHGSAWHSECLTNLSIKAEPLIKTEWIRTPHPTISGEGGLSADNAGLPVCLTFMWWNSLFSPWSELGTTLPLLRGMKGQHIWGFLCDIFVRYYVYWLLCTKMMLWSKQYSNALDEEWVNNNYGGVNMYWCNMGVVVVCRWEPTPLMAEAVPRPSSTSPSSWKIYNCCVNDV